MQKKELHFTLDELKRGAEDNDILLSSCFLKLGISTDGQRQGRVERDLDLDTLSKVLSNGFCHKQELQPYADAAFDHFTDNFDMYSLEYTPKVFKKIVKKAFFLTSGMIQANGDQSLTILNSHFSLKYRGTRKM
jgi:hypothetical protein